MFTVNHFGRMLTDGVRHAIHVEALRRLVRPDSIVLDIGTGTGVYALIAARLGARHVYAIDPNPGVQLGRQHAVDNGLHDRITFTCGLSTELVLAEPADLVVADLRDTLPFNGSHFRTLADARRRLLAPGGVLLPAHDVVWIAPVERPGLTADVRGPWATPLDGLDLGAALEIEANTVRYGRFEPTDLVAEPSVFARLDYAVPDELHRVHTLDVDVTATRDGIVDAIGIWFDATVHDDLRYTSGPFGPPTVYQQAYLPLRDPLTVRRGQPVRLEVSCRPGDGWDWFWQASTAEASGSPWRQSTRRARLVTDEALLELRCAR